MGAGLHVSTLSLPKDVTVDLKSPTESCPYPFSYKIREAFVLFLFVVSRATRISSVGDFFWGGGE